ncbi:MAG TPA: cutinase family protein [Candidatus Saccharimonadales bacterium]|nr:cutinase family protein [Candidatus Saccharimonadales bacterium]
MKNLVLIIILPAIVIALLISTTSFAKNSPACRSVDMIFARGSGQATDRAEARKFFEQIGYRLSENSFNIYELGTSEQDGYQYPAVTIKNNFLYTNAVGAWLSSGEGFAYGHSVKQGIGELKAYLTKLYSHCPNSHIVLGGYSQGAHVIGQTIPLLPREIRDQIVFAALFGDPRLNLPEGRGFNPPACREEDLSPWRREVENCDTDNGSLGARHPYVPKDMEEKTGLWCKDKDIICGSTKNPFFSPGHNKYTETGGAIDQAGKEIAAKLKTRGTDAVDTRPKVAVIGPDVFFIIDNSSYTWNMQRRAPMDDYQWLQQKAIDIVQQQHGRVGMIAFCGCNEGTNTYIPLSDNPTGVILKLESLNYAGYPTYDRAVELKTLIEQAKQRESWRPGAKRVILPVPVTRAQPTVAVSSYRFARLAFSSSTSPLFNVYPVVGTNLATTFNYLETSDTKVHTPAGSTPQETLHILLDTFDAQLDANLRGLDYRIYPGEEVKFDASNSDVYHDTITQYEWDFTSDGTIDQVTNNPTVSHTYNSEFTGIMTVRVVTEGGLSDTATAKVKIANDLSEPTLPAPTGLKLEVTSNSTVRLTWNPISESHNGWMLSVNAILLGRIAPDQTFINISDVEFDEDAEYGIQAIMTDGTLGEKSTILLKASGAIANTSQGKEDEHKPAGSTQTPSQSNIESKPDNSALSDATNREVKSRERLTRPLSAIPYAIGGSLIALGVAMAIYIVIRLRKKQGLHSL